MARSISAPWIERCISDMLRDSTPEESCTSQTGTRRRVARPHVVQILRGIDAIRCLEISDKETSVTVFLTDAGYDIFQQNHPHVSLSSLRNSLVKIEAWHVSTVLQAAGDRDFSRVRDVSITFPFALQTSKITWLGAGECDRVGDPVDINRINSIRAMLSRIPYARLTEGLCRLQFPDQVALPDSLGHFSVPHKYDAAHPLEWNHAVIPEDQIKQLSSIRESVVETQTSEGSVGTLAEHICIWQSNHTQTQTWTNSTSGGYSLLPNASPTLSIEPTQLDQISEVGETQLEEDHTQLDSAKRLSQPNLLSIGQPAIRLEWEDSQPVAKSQGAAGVIDNIPLLENSWYTQPMDEIAIETMNRLLNPSNFVEESIVQTSTTSDQMVSQGHQGILDEAFIAENNSTSTVSHQLQQSRQDYIKIVGQKVILNSGIKTTVLAVKRIKRKGKWVYKVIFENGVEEIFPATTFKRITSQSNLIFHIADKKLRNDSLKQKEDDHVPNQQNVEIVHNATSEDHAPKPMSRSFLAAINFLTESRNVTISQSRSIIFS